MRSRLTATGRRRLGGVLVVAICALVAAGVSQAGGATPSTAKSTIYKDRDACTFEPAINPIGTVTFTRKKDILTVKVSLRDAEPGTYTVYLYQFANNYCGDSFKLGTFNVSASGDGSRVGSADVSGEGKFFFVDVVGSNDNESDVVKV